MMCSELREMISDLCPSIGFTMVPTLEDGSGWVLNAFIDCVNQVEVRYHNVAIPLNFLVTSEARRFNVRMGDPVEVAEKVVSILTNKTLAS